MSVNHSPQLLEGSEIAIEGSECARWLLNRWPITRSPDSSLCYLSPLMPPLTVLYAIAIFLGSFLLFLIEPMAAKRLVPLLGGSAAVWTTCLVFFQVALLLGYVCAHWLATRLQRRAQALIYTFLLAVCVAQAVYNLRPELHASTMRPVASVFLVLGTLIGVPFVVLSATNPLLQAWYAGGAARFSAATSSNPGAAGVV